MDLGDRFSCSRPFLHYLDNQPGNVECIDDSPLQQDDNYKPFFLGIAKGGLDFMYAKTSGLSDPMKHFHGKTKHPKNIIIVGAGMAGLSAAFELRQAGHKVTILERQHRVGGRTKTIQEPFTRGLHAEGGAMRLPGTGEEHWDGPSHFLTDHYVRLFDVKTRPFQNVNERCFLHIYGNDNITLKEWKANNKELSDKYWPGWDANLPHDVKVDGIESLYEKTMEPVKQELIKDSSKEGWERWVKKWSQLSVREFFQTDLYQDEEGPKLRPWPEQAIQAFIVSNYSPFLSISLVEFLRDELGGWWEDPMYTPENGMEDIAWSFVRKNPGGWNSDVWLEKDIKFGVKVERIEIVAPERSNGVVVEAENSITGKSMRFSGDAVIVTVPINILRQMDIPLTKEQQQALNFITYEASTKILLQYRKRFWQEQFDIQGGMTTTNLPIGQVHYPDWPDSNISSDQRGVLVCYTWAQDALIFGGQDMQSAVNSAVKEIEKVHPGSQRYFEVGTVQAWFNDQTAQGAFTFLRPGEYNSALPQLMKNNPPLFLAGEALSWSNGWIQGALESGLRAAFQFYVHNEKTAN